MEKIIEIDLLELDDLLERYNRKKVSLSLIEYIIKQTPNFKKNDNLKIIINNKIKGIDCVSLIKEGLKEEYNNNLKKHFYNDIIQIIYLIIGVAILFVYTLIKESIAKELVLISGWVFIWSVVELELFSDSESRKRRIILNKLLLSEFVVNQV